MIAFEGVSTFHLSIPYAVFGEDRRDAGVPRYRVTVCAAEKGPLYTSAGFTLTGLQGLETIKRSGTVIIPGWRTEHPEPPAPLLKALQQAHRRGATLVGLCLGSYVLAAAGLLDGRRAATHWLCAEALAARYPKVRVDRDVLYVDEGDIITSAGSAAGIDCCLHLLRRWHGAEVAGRVARRLVVPPHRPGGQAQYIEQPLQADPEDARFAQALAWVERNLREPHRLDELAGRLCMSRRTFTRRFRQTTGTTFGQWLLHRRVLLAQRLLETTAKPLNQIAEESGLGTECSLRTHFRQKLKVSPSRYRREFQGA